MTVELDRDRATDLALARSVLYGTLTLGCCAPAAETSARLTSPDARRAIEVAGAFVDALRVDAAPVMPSLRRLAAFDTLALADLERDYERLFGHTARGEVCPFETEYGLDAFFRQPQEMADMAGYYRAFGLVPAAGQRVDHVGCQCEFMAFLCRKEARALAAIETAHDEERQRLAEMLDTTREAARLFLRHHVGRFGPAFARSLMTAARQGLYGVVGEALFIFLGLECERLRVPAGPVTLEVRPPLPDPSPASCGTGEEVVQIQHATSV